MITFVISTGIRSVDESPARCESIHISSIESSSVLVNLIYIESSCLVRDDNFRISRFAFTAYSATISKQSVSRQYLGSFQRFATGYYLLCIITLGNVCNLS